MRCSLFSLYEFDCVQLTYSWLLFAGVLPAAAAAAAVLKGADTDEHEYKVMD